MKKKLWIRLVGVAALLAWVFAGLLFRASQLAPDINSKAGFALESFLAVGLSALITVVWALFSVIDWGLRRQAKLQAAQLAQGLPAGRGPQAPAPEWPAPARAPAPDVPVCAECQRYLAEFVCTAHNRPLCSQCAAPHTQASEGCTLRGLPRIATAQAPRPRPVVTSPLAGLR